MHESRTSSKKKRSEVRMGQIPQAQKRSERVHGLCSFQRPLHSDSERRRPRRRRVGLGQTGGEETRIRLPKLCSCEAARCTDDGEGSSKAASIVTRPTQKASSAQQQGMPETSPQLHPPPPPPADPNAAASWTLAAANALPTLIPVKPRMIIKGVLGRYERWNPVHPTAGAFWGVGLGLGCGVGWGPGFGPEVIGYVGAGCGLGFSVGVTLAGVGIGLPQHGLFKDHYHRAGFVSNIPLESARFYTMTIIKGLVWDAISYASQVAATRKESRQKLLRFQDNSQISGGADLPKLGKGVSSSIRSMVECIRAFKDQHWPP